ncbi:MAG TPA: pitrilysin family protein [Verrucomicrobiae bacterium]|jgi:zinc protease|nr:pitrilysin family protein [Verrucomicrobiae bacterium]
MKNRIVRSVVAGLMLAAVFAFAPVHALAANLPVTRATLSNGLEVVVVHDPLAPVVTVMMNYRVGSDDQPLPGLAHATEHMMFRGSKTLSSNQLMESVGVTGGDFDADTQDQVTQYFFTLPAQYLDIALRAERSRATGLLMAQNLWAQERGAITQEVTQDNSNAILRLFIKMQRRLVDGTPYAKDGLGTVYGFAHLINSPQLLSFYHTWYHPNNAIYVIVGDVDGPSTIAKVKALFGDIPAAKLPGREVVHLKPITGTVFNDTSDQPYTAVLLGYRMPGYGSPDYAAGRILGDVLNSQRGDLFALAASGKAYGTQFFVQSYPKTSIAVAFAAVPVSTKPEVADGWIRAIIAGYKKNGVPADLVAASKLREVSQLEFAGNSIEGLANQWSQALAVQHLQSPDDMISAFSKVTTADVNRVLQQYLDTSAVVAAYAVPKNNGKLSTGSGSALGVENNAIPPSKHEPLPSWAQTVLAHLRVPPQTLSPVSMLLSNGVRLIVQRETITKTVVVSGQILSDAAVQEPVGKDGVDDIAASLLPYGTTTYDRVGFQAELDKIAATTSAGTSFSLQVPAVSFDRGVALLADEELQPAFKPDAFKIVSQQEVKSVGDAANSPDHLTQVALDAALYPVGDPLRRFATPATAGAVTIDDVKSYYASVYRPDMTAIVVVGNVTPQAALASFERYFGSWSATGPKPDVFPAPVALNAPATIVVPATGRVQSSTQLVELSNVRRTDASYADLRVANTVLTGGFYSSLLYHDLREVHGYVYDVNSQITAGKNRSTFSIGYGSDPQNIVPAQEQIVAILSMLQSKPIDPDRLLRSKALLMGDVPIQIASYDGVAGLLLSYSMRDLPLDQNLIDARRELTATPTSVRAAISKWIRPKGFVRIVTGPGPK